MVFFFKQKTAYEMRISDWSSDVCSSDLLVGAHQVRHARIYPLGDDALRVTGAGVGARQPEQHMEQLAHQPHGVAAADALVAVHRLVADLLDQPRLLVDVRRQQLLEPGLGQQHRSEEHTSELQSLMRISYAVFCLQKKTT